MKCGGYGGGVCKHYVQQSDGYFNRYKSSVAKQF